MNLMPLATNIWNFRPFPDLIFGEMVYPPLRRRYPPRDLWLISRRMTSSDIRNQHSNLASIWGGDRPLSHIRVLKNRKWFIYRNHLKLLLLHSNTNLTIFSNIRRQKLDHWSIFGRTLVEGKPAPNPLLQLFWSFIYC